MIKDLLKLCENKDLIYIKTHNFPDSDAIGAGYGLFQLLNHYGISAKLVYSGKIDMKNTLNMVTMLQLPIEYHDGHFAATDNVICIDCQYGESNITIEGCQPIGCIDHHPRVRYHEYSFLYHRVTGSSSTLITELFIEAGITPDLTTATALLYGLKMDTLHFTRGTTPADIKAFYYLYDKANNDILNYLTHNKLLLEDLRAYGSGIKDVFTLMDLGFSFIPFDCPDGLIASISDFLLDVEEINLSFVFSQRPNGIKLSVRSMDPHIHAGDLTILALKDIGNGGGHAMFAGGFIPNQNFIEDKSIIDTLRKKFLTSYGEILKQTL